MHNNRSVGALVLLNGESLEESLLDLVWPTESVDPTIPYICTDGAANLLFTMESERSSLQKRVPSHIVGDLDSVTQTVREHYAKLGTKIVEIESQDSNDFHKALNIAMQTARVADQNLPIIVIGGMAGRMDQTLANINELYACAERGVPTYWVSTANLATMLPPGSHAIHLGSSGVGAKCGLIPIGGAVASVTTRGLRWDMKNQALGFGTHKLVSSSNEAVQGTVTIETSDPVLWTLSEPVGLR